LNNNMGLQKDGVALLIILWALMILPKRERQIARRERGDAGQGDMFGEAKPMPRGEEVSGAIPEATLLADFGDKLGGKMRLNVNLGVLSRLGFIARRSKIIHEGPLLDLLLDYPLLERRIIDGALAELLARRSESAAEEEAPVSDPDEDI